MTKIVVAGTPESKGLLRQIFTEISKADNHVVEFYGSALNTVDPIIWQNVEILVCYGLTCGRTEMERAPKLRAIVSPTIGYEWIDEDAASALGILLVNGAISENHESMAEATILLILASLYDLPGAQCELHNETGIRIPPRMLKAKTVGLVGYGNIAQAIVARLRGWGVTFLAHRRSCKPVDDKVHLVTLETLLEKSDVVVVLTSLNEESKHLIDADALDRMKPDAVLINVSRGGVIDEKSLERRLADNGLSMVALDVFETEPLPAESLLRQFSNAILTPHSIGHTVECLEAIPRAAFKNVLALSRGEVPLSTRNKHIVTAWMERLG